MRIRAKVVLLIFSIVVVTGAVATLVGRHIAMNIVTDEIGDHLVTTAQSRAQAIEMTVEDQHQRIELLATEAQAYLAMLPAGTMGLLEESNPAMGFILSSIANSALQVRVAMYLDSNGIVMATTSPEFIGADTSGAEFFRHFADGARGTFIGETTFSQSLSDGEESRDFMLAAAAPLLNGSEIEGIVVFLGAEDAIAGIASDRSGLGDRGEVYIINQHGTMLTPSRFTGKCEEITGTGLWEPERKAISSQNYLGQSVLTVRDRIPELGWTVVVDKGASEAFAPVHSLTRIMIWSLMGVLALGALLSMLVSRAITRPIVRLHRGAEEIMRGNWDYDVSTGTKDEIGQLSRAFGRMTQNLKTSQQESRRYASTLEQQVKEKDVLLKEIHHRVKNNLQVISSLLNLQSGSVTDEKTLQALKESQNRVRSMALVHERLYQSDDLSRVDFGEYIRSLASHLLRTYKSGSNGIILEIQAENTSIEIDSAIPCALIINELLTNSLKYAFPNGASGVQDSPNKIRVEFSSNGGQYLTLAVKDNGIGLPEDFDIDATNSLGLQLVHTLTGQLGGTLTYSSDSGAKFTIVFAEAGPKGRGR